VTLSFAFAVIPAASCQIAIRGISRTSNSARSVRFAKAICVLNIDDSVGSVTSSTVFPAIHMVNDDLSFLVLFTILVIYDFLFALESADSVHTHDIIPILSRGTVVSVVRTFVDVLE
jgi:hypothetical protein